MRVAMDDSACSMVLSEEGEGGESTYTMNKVSTFHLDVVRSTRSDSRRRCRRPNLRRRQPRHSRHRVIAAAAATAISRGGIHRSSGLMGGSGGFLSDYKLLSRFQSQAVHWKLGDQGELMRRVPCFHCESCMIRDRRPEEEEEEGDPIVIRR